MPLIGWSDLQVELLMLVHLHASWQYLYLVVLFGFFTSPVLRSFSFTEIHKWELHFYHVIPKIICKKPQTWKCWLKNLWLCGEKYKLFFPFSQNRATDQSYWSWWRANHPGPAQTSTTPTFRGTLSFAAVHCSLENHYVSLLEIQQCSFKKLPFSFLSAAVHQHLLLQKWKCNTFCHCFLFCRSGCKPRDGWGVWERFTCCISLTKAW